MVNLKQIKIPIKFLACIIAISIFVASIPTFNLTNVKAAYEETVISNFTVTDIIGQPVENALVEVFSDENRENELESAKTEANGIIEIELQEIDVYYYTVSADDMFSQSGFFTKTEPAISIVMVNDAKCHKCDAKGTIECPTCEGTGEVQADTACSNCLNGKVTMICPKCNGVDSELCSICNGSGTILEDCDICNGTGVVKTREECPDCNGTKEIICDECNGNKYVPAYDFDFKFEKDVSIKRNSENVINPVIVEENTSKGTISYSSSDESIVQVDNEGRLTAKGNAGQTATITAKISFDNENGYAPKTTSCKVTITKEDNFSNEFDVYANLVYTGEAQTLISPKEGGDVDLETLIINVFDASGNKVEEAVDAGVYTVNFSDINHNEASVNVEIAKAALTVVPLEGQTKYFGEEANIKYDIKDIPENGSEPIFTGNLSYESVDELINTADPDAVDVEGPSIITKGSLALDSTVKSNENYTFNFDNSKNIKIDVVLESSDIKLIPEDAQEDQYWFNKNYMDEHNGKVVFKAPEGYKISKEKRHFSTEVSFSDEGEYNNQVLYLQESDASWFEKIFGGKVQKIEVSFGIDITCPTFKAEFKAENDNILASIGRILGFGAYFKEQIVVYISADDKAENTSGLRNGSGIEDIQVVLNNGTEDINFEQNSDGRFILAEGTGTISGTVYVTVEDKAGNLNFVNQGRELVTTENSNLKSQDYLLMLENTQPVINDIQITPIDKNRPSEYIFNGANVYSGDVEFTFSVEDSDSGIYYTDISINGKSVNDILDENHKLDVGPFYKNKQTEKLTYSVSTEDFKADADGSYKITVKSSDAAGNLSCKEEKIYVDRHAPIVKSFEITGNTGTADGSDSPRDVILTDYGFYFKDSAYVKVTFGDYKEQEELLSGLSQAKIYLVDKDGTIYRVTESGAITNKNVEGNVISSIEDDILPITLKSEFDSEGNNIGSFTFKVDKNFKGQIYALAIDNTGNTLVNGALAPLNASDIIGEDLSFNQNGYQKPSGSIIENEDKHNSSYTIDIIAPETSKKDINGYPLYNDPDGKGINLNLLVKDTYSGIKSIEVSVEAPYDRANNYYHKVTVGPNAKDINAITYVGNEKENDWSVDETDENIATVMSNVINVSNDSNGITISVKLTDRAGNESIKSYVISLDKTAPEIEVVYNNNQFENNRYYQDDRTATVIIRELNLSSSLQITVDATRDGQNIAPTEYEIEQIIQDVYNQKNYEKYHKVVGEGDTEREYYEFRFTINGNIQGDYSITVASVDNAGNKDMYDRTDEFSVDNTTPFITVSFDNNDAENGMYYGEKRVATITVTDRYFDASNTSILIAAADNGIEFNSPQPSDWSKQNEEYEQSCTVEFDRDGTYSITIDSTDLSGKAASQYIVTDFVIDLTSPTIGITINGEQIKNGSSQAYIDEVVPQVVVKDTNFSDADTTITLTPVITKDGTNLIYDNQIVSDNSDFVNGMVYNYNNFQGEEGNKRIYDNIYILEVSTTDKAGNTTEPQKIIFSVNRYGSTYNFKVNDYYTERPVIQIEEVNVNAIDFDSEETYITVTSMSGTSKTFKAKDLNIQTQEATDSNWYSYIYAIPSSTFDVDDVYSVKLSSRDIANRLSTNLNNANNQEISFTVDTTNPYFEVVNYNENENLKESEYELVINIMDDTSGVAKYNIMFDGQQVAEPYIAKTFENKIEVRVPIEGATQLKQAAGRKLKVEITDAAGRTNYTSDDDDNSTFNVRISSSVFVDALAKVQDFYHNTVAFWCTITGVIVLVGIILWILLARKKRNKSDKSSE